MVRNRLEQLVEHLVTPSMVNKIKGPQKGEWMHKYIAQGVFHCVYGRLVRRPYGQCLYFLRVLDNKPGKKLLSLCDSVFRACDG
jgi:hypothetical protein